MTDLAPVAAPPDSTPRRRWKAVLARVGIVLAMASVLPWLYGISQTGRQPNPPDYLEDRTFPEEAEPICAAAMEKVADFPPAEESSSPTERAAVLRDSTAVLAAMTSELRSLVPPGADARWINTWIDHWNLHIDDREDFARRLDAGGASEEFLESTVEDVQVSRSIDRYATVNRMESCQTPGDV